MEVKVFDLYANGRLLQVEIGEIMLVRDKIDYSESMGDSEVVVTADTELTYLASKYYGAFVAFADRLWWIIADANPVILNPLDLSDCVGLILKIPDISLLKVKGVL
jgi:hypothetical protein